MQKIRFENFKAGAFVSQGDYKAFVPAKINCDWVWEDGELNSLLAEANQELGGLNTYSDLIPNIDVYIQMHIFAEANKSNIIEGTKTSIEEDIMNPDDVNPERRNDSAEVKNYIKALNYGVKRIKQDGFPLSTRLLREIHEKLMQGVRGEKKTPGEFRKSQNWLGGTMPSNAVFVPPPTHEINGLLSDMEKFVHEFAQIPDLIKIALIHYQFETIHPFLDGNGRIGRIIIPLYLLSKNCLDKPCFYISNFFEKNRLEYYDRLNAVRTNNDLVGWIKFFLRASIETAKSAKQKFKKAIEVVDEYQAYLSNHRSGKNLKLVLDVLYQIPVMNTADLQKSVGLPQTTLFRTLNMLATDGIISELTGYNRNRIFTLDKYISVFK